MDDENRQISLREEWQKAASTQRVPRASKPTETGTEALAKCKALLAEYVEPPPEPARACVHEFEPCAMFAHTERCIHCSTFRDVERPPEKPSNQPPLDAYKNFP